MFHDLPSSLTDALERVPSVCRCSRTHHFMAPLYRVYRYSILFYIFPGVRFGELSSSTVSNNSVLSVLHTNFTYILIYFLGIHPYEL